MSLNMRDYAVDLAKRGFHVFPIREMGKLPAIKEWPDRATCDADAVRRMWSTTAGPKKLNIGIHCGRFGKDQYLLGLDIDNKDGKDGSKELAGLEAQHGALPATLVIQTPSGGFHHYFLVDEPVGNSASKIGQGLDIRGLGGFLVAPGSRVSGGKYDLAIPAFPKALAKAPEWLVRLASTPKKKKSTQAAAAVELDVQANVDRARSYLETADPAIEGAGGDARTFAVACRVRDFGVSEAECLALMVEHWNERCAPPWDTDELADKVANAYRYGENSAGASTPESDFADLKVESSDSEPSGDAAKKKAKKTSTPESGGDGDEIKGNPYERAIAKLNGEYAVVKTGSKHCVMRRYKSKEGPQHETMEERTFMALMAGWSIPVGDQKTTKAAVAWWGSPDRKTYWGFAYRPDLPYGEFKDHGRTYYNTWRGFRVEPADCSLAEAKKGCSMILEHMRENIAGGVDPYYYYVLGFFAHAIQRPDVSPGVCLVLQGDKGTGKTIVSELVGDLLGEEQAMIFDDDRPFRQYNEFLEGTTMLTLDEAYYSGDKAASGKLKGMVTGRHLTIEAKYKGAYQVLNALHIVIISNEARIVDAGGLERRFAMFTMGNRRRQDGAYFAAMRAQMQANNNWGYRCLLKVLQSFDIDSVNLKVIPRTESLREQRLHSMQIVEQWLYDGLYEGSVPGFIDDGWPSEMLCEEAFNSVNRYWKSRNVRIRAPSRQYLHRIMEEVLGVQRKQLRRGELEDDGKARKPVRVYELPTLAEGRKKWDEWFGQTCQWPEDGAE